MPFTFGSLYSSGMPPYLCVTHHTKASSHISPHASDQTEKDEQRLTYGDLTPDPSALRKPPFTPQHNPKQQSVRTTSTTSAPNQTTHKAFNRSQHCTHLNHEVRFGAIHHTPIIQLIGDQFANGFAGLRRSVAAQFDGDGTLRSGEADVRGRLRRRFGGGGGGH